MPTTDALGTLANPLRLRVLLALRERGSATATELAGDLGTHTGATSYHLRQLAAAGLIEDSGAGVGRRRVWREVDQAAPWRLPELDDDPDLDAETTLSWVDRDVLRHAAEHTDRWLDAAPRWPVAWQNALGLDDAYVVVTADQLADLRGELTATVDRYRRVGQGSPGARRVAVWTAAYPVDLERPPAPATADPT